MNPVKALHEIPHGTWRLEAGTVSDIQNVSSYPTMLSIERERENKVAHPSIHVVSTAGYLWTTE